MEKLFTGTYSITVAWPALTPVILKQLVLIECRYWSTAWIISSLLSHFRIQALGSFLVVLLAFSGWGQEAAYPIWPMQVDSTPAITYKQALAEANRLEAANQPVEAAQAWLRVAGAQCLLDEPCVAQNSAERAKRLLYATPEGPQWVNYYAVHTGILMKLGLLDEASFEAQRGLSQAKQQQSSYMQAWFLAESAMVHAQLGDLPTAQKQLQLAETLAQNSKDNALQIKILQAETVCEARNGLADRAEELILQTMALAKASNDKYAMAICLAKLVALDIEQGTMEHAAHRIDRMEQLGAEAGSRRITMNAHRMRGQLLLHQGKYAQAFSILEQVLLESKDLSAAWTTNMTLMHLSTGHRNALQFAEALEYLVQGIAHAEAHQYQFHLGKFYAATASVYTRSGEPEKAEMYIDQCLAIADQFGLEILQILIFHQQAVVAENARKYPEMIYYLKKARSIAHKQARKSMILSLDIHLMLAHFYNSNGEVVFRIADSLMTQQETLKQFPPTAGKAYSFLGQVYRNIDPELSKSLLRKSVALNKQVDQVESNLHPYFFLELIHTEEKDYESALNYRKQFAKLKDSLYQAKVGQKVALLKMKLDTERKETELEKLKRDQVVQELQLSQQEAALAENQRVLVALVLFALLTLLAGLLLVYRFRLRQKAEKLDLLAEQVRLKQENQETRERLALEALRTRFFTDVSHELRTPLTLIKGPLDALIANNISNPKEQLQLMQRNTDKLMELVNQTLDLAKLESGHLKLYPRQLPFADFVQETCRPFFALARQHDIKFEVIDHSGNQPIAVDPAKLEKTIANLLSNAFKHTPKDGTIQVRIALEPQQQDRESLLRVAVFNSGAGIPESHLPHLFDRFYQAEDKPQNGSGIGLALAREIVELHGGSIQAQSEEGVGTTFTFYLPLEELASAISDSQTKVFIFPKTSEATSVNQLPQEQPSTHQKHALDEVILVVDDQPDMRTYIEQLFQDGYEVITAANGSEALDLARQQAVDLIVSDVMMPGMDGFQLTETLKSQLATSHIPIVLLTAKGSQDSRLVGLEHGADDYLVKPFHTPELLTRVKNLIAQRKLLRQRFAGGDGTPPATLVRNKQDARFLSKALEVVHTHLNNEDFTVELFSQELALNRTSVHLKLKALTGMSASQYIKHIRVSKAAELIREGQESMAEVAFLAGFKSRQEFNKAFKAQFKMTPSEYARY